MFVIFLINLPLRQIIVDFRITGFVELTDGVGVGVGVSIGVASGEGEALDVAKGVGLGVAIGDADIGVPINFTCTVGEENVKPLADR